MTVGQGKDFDALDKFLATGKSCKSIPPLYWYGNFELASIIEVQGYLDRTDLDTWCMGIEMQDNACDRHCIILATNYYQVTFDGS
jgi:hypothetical protein